MNYFIHKTAEIAKNARIGKNTKIWHYCQIREDAVIGENCKIAKNVYIDFGIHIGNNCKIQNNCSLYHGVTLEDGVFVGPHVVFANDKIPRAINPDGTLKTAENWSVGKIHVKYGACIGAQSVILPDITIGSFSLVGAGSVVTKDVPDFSIVYGNPAVVHGYICVCEKKLIFKNKKFYCNCGRKYKIIDSQVKLINKI